MRNFSIVILSLGIALGDVCQAAVRNPTVTLLGAIDLGVASVRIPDYRPFSVGAGDMVYSFQPTGYVFGTITALNLSSLEVVYTVNTTFAFNMLTSECGRYMVIHHHVKSLHGNNHSESVDKTWFYSPNGTLLFTKGLEMQADGTPLAVYGYTLIYTHGTNYKNYRALDVRTGAALPVPRWAGLKPVVRSLCNNRTGCPEDESQYELEAWSGCPGNHSLEIINWKRNATVQKFANLTAKHSFLGSDGSYYYFGGQQTVSLFNKTATTVDVLGVASFLMVLEDRSAWKDFPPALSADGQLLGIAVGDGASGLEHLQTFNFSTCQPSKTPGVPWSADCWLTQMISIQRSEYVSF